MFLFENSVFLIPTLCLCVLIQPVFLVEVSPGDQNSNDVIANGWVFDPEADTFPYDDYNTTEDRSEVDFYQDHFAAITKDVTSINGKTYWPSLLTVFGKNSFVVATDGSWPVIAAALYGKGRVYVSGSLQYVHNDFDPGLTNLTKNAVNWLANTVTPKVASIDHFTVNGFETAKNVALDNIGSANVYLIQSSTLLTKEEIEKVKSYVSGGGGLIIAGQAWSWYYRSRKPSETYNDFVGNKLAIEFGIILGRNVYSAKSLKTSIDMNIYYVMHAMTLPSTSLSGDNIKLVTNSLSNVLTVQNANDPAMSELFAITKKAYESLASTTDKRLYSKLSITMVPIILLKERISIHKAPDHATFPGAVPDGTKKVSKTLEVNGSYAGYPRGFLYSGAHAPLLVSTGLYAAAGDVIKVEIEQQFWDTIATKRAIGIQIGCHRSALYHKKTLKRSPEITIKSYIKGTTSYAAGPWGGLVYVRIPHGANYGMFKITISNAVEAPHFVLGKHTLEDWKTIRNFPAPWGELETPNQIIFTVQSSVLRDYADPQDLLRLYKDVMYKYDWLQGFNGTFRFRAERFAMDIELFTDRAWMHSGYPMQGYWTYSKKLIDVANARNGRTWGEFHELGHNSQWKDYTTSKTTESGCNVYAHHVFQVALNKTIRSHTQTWVDQYISDWLLSGKKDYGGHIAALSYTLLMDRYGYENWRKMNMYYQQNRNPVKDADKYDTFARVLTNIMKLDLCPYFEFFTYKLSEETKTACKAQPKMPDLIIDRYNPVTNVVESGDHKCPDGWLLHGKSCFFFSPELRNWQDAEDTCAQSKVPNSHLASCLTSEEAFFLTNYTVKNSLTDNYFIGIDELNKDDKPRYLNGDDLPALLPWKAKYPKVGDRNKCIVARNGKLYDMHCGTKAKFICKAGATSCGPKVSCPKGWMRNGERCYWVYYGYVTFATAVASCHHKTSSLLEINSEDEFIFIKAIQKRVRWTGQHYWRNYWLAMNGTEKWMTPNTQVGYSKWCEGVNTEGAKGIAMSVANTYCWKMCDKCTHLNAFICEKPGILEGQPVPASPNTTCDSGWFSAGAHCYKVSSDKQTMNDAAHGCLAMGSGIHLASCLDSTSAFLLSYELKKLNSKETYHVGLHATGKDGQLVFMNNQPVTELMPYAPGYPDPKDQKQCTAVKGGQFVSYGCEAKLLYVCQKSNEACGDTTQLCPKGWIRRYEKCYFVYIGAKTLAEALSDCIDKQSNLLEIGTNEENKYLVELARRLMVNGQYYWENYWIGNANALSKKWMSGKEVTVSNWCRNQRPLHNGLVYMSSNKFCWKNCVNCQFRREAYICEKPFPVKSISTTPTTCKDGWHSIGESCFLIVQDKVANANDAELSCRRLGGDSSHLASCLSTTEAFSLFKYLGDKSIKGNFFIGLDQNNEKKTTANVDGSTITGYLPWDRDRPIENGVKKCFALINRYVRNVNCFDEMNYVCKSGPNSCGPKSVCPEGWFRNQNTCFWTFFGAQTFDASVSDCRSKKAKLLEIENKDKNKFIVGYMRAVRRNKQYFWRDYFIGIKDAKSDTWMSGKTVKFSNWCDGSNAIRLTNGKGYMKSHTYCWMNGAGIESKKEAYICEKPIA